MCDKTYVLTESQIKHIRAEAFEEIEDIIADVERCHKDHTENENGEWLTFTVDYDKWADMFIKLRKLKEDKNGYAS